MFFRHLKLHSARASNTRGIYGSATHHKCLSFIFCTIEATIYSDFLHPTRLPSYIPQDFRNRSISWLEFGECTDDLTQVTVTIASPNTFQTASILPISYDIPVTISSDASSGLSLSLSPARAQSIKISYGNNILVERNRLTEPVFNWGGMGRIARIAR